MRLFLLLAMAVSIGSVVPLGCGYEPDTSAPDRVEIERNRDWTGALLYIADESGPATGWGSVRIYDNISGFVEKTIEQTRAASPGDVFVTADGGSMYVASKANGLIEKFSWDGNSWISSAVTIETPAASISVIREGPDDRLYAIDGMADPNGATIYKIDFATSAVVDQTRIPSLGLITGLDFNAEGSSAYIAGTDTQSSSPVLLVLSWPAAETIQRVRLPLVSANQLILSPDGRFLYVTGVGKVLKVDAATGEVLGSISPSPEAGLTYVDADFSADGAFLFVVGGPAAAPRTLYVIELASGSVVKTVNNIASKAAAVQRVE